ncbi:MAG TPA: PqqD family protein [Bacilli bacterium]|nr:PqqD family protein [Bacilli bacterium]
MKIKKGFMLREVAGNYVVVPVGEASKEFKGIITLNISGAFLWKSLLEETTKEKLLEKFLGEYDIDQETATKDIDVFLDKVRSVNILE